MRIERLIPVAALASLLLVAGVVLGFVVWEFSRAPVSMKTLRDLPLGATPQQIQHRLGRPQDEHDLYGDHRWCYYRTNSTSIVYVIFDTNMLYAGYEVDD